MGVMGVGSFRWMVGCGGNVLLWNIGRQNIPVFTALPSAWVEEKSGSSSK
jgi:hypothetical protein